MITLDTLAAASYRAAPAILAAALALMLAAPAFASAEAPVAGSATVMTAPRFATAGTEGAAETLPVQSSLAIIRGGPQASSGSEADLGPKV
jgi:hypothetical protein